MFAHIYRRFHFYHWFSVSLVLHAGILLPFVLISLHTPAQRNYSKLQIELFGMIADRQTEEKLQRQAPPSPPQPRTVKKHRRAPKTYKAIAAKSPVQVKKQEEKPKPAEQKDQPEPAEQTNEPIPATAAPLPDTLADASRSGNADEQQRQQTIRTAAEQEANRIRRYTASLAKQLRSHLAYPEEVRKYGIDGVSTITFVVTPSGDIKGDSLRIKKSSGYAALDASALMAARSSAPFERPPKELTVSIAVSFSISLAKVHTKQPSES